MSSALFNLYVNDMPPPSHHVELTLYEDDTAITATSRKPTLLVSYLVCVPRVEVRRPHPCPEAISATMQVSSPCY